MAEREGHAVGLPVAPGLNPTIEHKPRGFFDDAPLRRVKARVASATSLEPLGFLAQGTAGWRSGAGRQMREEALAANLGEGALEKRDAPADAVDADRS